MSIRFTIAVGGDFHAQAQLLRSELLLDPAVELSEHGGDLIAYFAGTAHVRNVSMGGRGLASLRILSGSLVVAVDGEGYEASAQHLAMYVRWFLGRGPCRIFDDETGNELTWRIEACPETLFAPELEFEDTE